MIGALNYRVTLLIAICSIIFLGCEGSLELSELEEKDGLFFERASNLLYAGLVVEYSEKGHLLRKLNISNGKKW